MVDQYPPAEAPSGDYAGPASDGAVGRVAVGIVLTGTRGAGKSAVAQELDAAGTGIHVRSVTTREPRADDCGHYDYLTSVAFDEEAAAGRFLLVASYRGRSYGVRVQEVARATAAGVPPILTVTPAATAAFLASDTGISWRGVYLDAPDSILDGRLAVRGFPASPGDIAQRAADRAACGGILPVVMNDRSLAEVVAAVAAAVGSATSA